jgi:hypothetical protein
VYGQESGQCGWGSGVLKLRGDNTLEWKRVCIGLVAEFKVWAHANQGETYEMKQCMHQT